MTQEELSLVIERTIKNIPENILSEEAIRLLAENSTSIEDFSLICKSFYSEAKQYSNVDCYKNFLTMVENSDFSYKDWLHSLVNFFSWLKKENKSARLCDMLSYLECCACSPDNLRSSSDLSGLLHEMILRHGFDKACQK